MIIKCEIAGNLIINDLNELKLAGGQVEDISLSFTSEQIKNSMRAPKGCLYTFIQAGHITTIQKTSSDYKEYVEKIQKDTALEIKAKIKEEERKLRIRYFRMTIPQGTEFIQGLTYYHYDFLLNLRNSEERPELMEAINNKLRDFADRRVAEGFILL